MQLTLIHAMRVTTTLTESLMKGHLKIACQGNNLTPELSLYLLSASCPLYSAPADDQHPLSSLSSDPWWSVYWPGGQVTNQNKVFDQSEHIHGWFLQDTSLTITTW